MAALDVAPGGAQVRGDSSNRSYDEQLGKNKVADKKPAADAKKPRDRKPPEPERLTPAMVKERWDKGVAAQSERVQDYWLNSAFLENHQWLWFNKASNRIDSIPRESEERVQATINKLKGASRSIVSKLVSRELRFEVMPDQADDATQRGAVLAESVIASVHQTLDWEHQREDAIWAVWKGGTVAIEVVWDPSAGENLGEDHETGKKVGTGEIHTAVHPITEFVVQPGTRDAEKGRYWITGVALPPEDVQALYQLHETPKADARSWSVPGAYSAGSQQDTFDLTQVLTYYERPNWLQPKGYVCVVVDNEFVEGPYDWPYPFTDRLNMVIMRETQIEAQALGSTVLTAARPVQVAFNASWSSIIEHGKLAGNARLAIPASSADLLDTLTDLPGEMIVYPDGSEKPGYVSPPMMPDWWKDQPSRLSAEIDDILGNHDISKGKAPAGVESGYGLTILAEQDSTPLGRLTKEQAIAWGKIAQMTLELYEENATETRKAVIHQPGMPTESVEWTGKDLMGQTLALVPLDAVTPHSRAAMQMFAEKAMQMGLIKTADQWAKLSMAPNSKELMEVAHPDVAKARRENHVMAQGEVAVPAEFDDHNAHVEEHNTFRKSVRYDLLDEDSKIILELHIQAHATLSAEELGEQYNKSLHNPLLAAAANPKGAPSLSVPDANQAQQKLEQEPGTMPPGGPTSPGGPGGMAPPLPTGPAGQADTLGEPAAEGPETGSPGLGAPTAAFPRGAPQPAPGGNF